MHVMKKKTIYLFKVSAGNTQTETVHHMPLYVYEKAEWMCRQDRPR
jgi:hypothetical protein